MCAEAEKLLEEYNAVVQSLVNLIEETSKGKTEETDKKSDTLIEKFKEFKKRMSEVNCVSEKDKSDFISSCEREIDEANKTKRSPEKKT
jgi:secreted Zn-dependent insulinase-like peptidase